MEKINVTVAFSDERGKITDLIENEEINSITLITFNKGAARGNHFHKETTQWNYLITGKIKLVTQIPGEKVVETIMLPGEFTVTRPNDRHALYAMETSEVMVFTKGPRGGKEYESDTFRLEVPLVSSDKK
jgi:quercetin dioxygenase-like cupin family protein